MSRKKTARSLIDDGSGVLIPVDYNFISFIKRETRKEENEFLCKVADIHENDLTGYYKCPFCRIMTPRIKAYIYCQRCECYVWKCSRCHMEMEVK